MRKKLTITVIVFLMLLSILGLGKQISEALQASSRLDKAAGEVSALQSQNQKLRNQLVEVQRPSFIEQQARNKLNYAKSNETIVIIPETLLKEVLKQSSPKPPEPKIPNYQGWFKLFFH